MAKRVFPPQWYAAQAARRKTKTSNWRSLSAPQRFAQENKVQEEALKHLPDEDEHPSKWMDSMTLAKKIGVHMNAIDGGLMRHQDHGNVTSQKHKGRWVYAQTL